MLSSVNRGVTEIWEAQVCSLSASPARDLLEFTKAAVNGRLDWIFRMQRLRSEQHLAQGVRKVDLSMIRASIIALRCSGALVIGAWSSLAFSATYTPTANPEANYTITATAITSFYRDRGGEPFWFTDSSAPAEELLKLLGTAEADGITKDKFPLGALVLAVREASTGHRAAVDRAELMLSEAFLTYAQELQRDPRVGVIYVDPELKPTPTPAAALLEEAASAGSLAVYVRELGWMNPLYGKLRQALTANLNGGERERYLLTLNLQRARALPRTTGRYVLVNTANQRLYMYDGGRVVDEMKVVVGRAEAQTPLMNAYIRFAVLNPYWNVPSDLTARLAPNVVRRGKSYLQQQGYQVVSDFGANPSIIDPARIDWKAVAAGQQSVQMRQLPGPANSMGRIKFMFPNSQGVWLHDTPTRELFGNTVRLESAGCIRLEYAWKLGSWLFRRPLSERTDEPERQLELPEPVPIYITYLTAIPVKSSVRFVEDVYRRNPPPLKAS